MEESFTDSLLQEAFLRSILYLRSLRNRARVAYPKAIQRLDELRHPLPRKGLDGMAILSRLDEIGSPATDVATRGSRPGHAAKVAPSATIAASWLAAVWGQHAFRANASVGSTLEDVSLQWLGDLLRMPENTAGALVNGMPMATFTALASARHALLARVGWDIEANGLHGAPELRVVASEDIPATVLGALSLLGLGRHRIVTVPTDRRGRIQPECLPELDPLTIVCIQAGNPSTGDFDPAAEVCRLARNAGAWVHVEGGLGLWALAHRDFDTLTYGLNEADSWATDIRVWLDLPQESGIVLVRDPSCLQAAMSGTAVLAADVWAALLSLGRDGIADRIEQSSLYARTLAEGLARAGYEVLNEVVLDVVLISLGSVETTRAVINMLRADGATWCDETTWQGRVTMRISVAGLAPGKGDKGVTGDVEGAVQMIVRAAEKVCCDTSPLSIFNLMEGP